jgi:cytochrome c oxidase cbb3-type subunit 2
MENDFTATIRRYSNAIAKHTLGEIMDHKTIETKLWLMVVLIVIVISFGGLAEIVPLFWQSQAKPDNINVVPLTALQLEGRDIYIREGCHVCHTQMVRPLRAETERYGHYSMAEESMYEHPFLWGSKRIGPDIARVGGRYSDDWHRVHLLNPRNVVPDSIMPSYPWLATNILSGELTARKLSVMRTLGVPYTDEDIANAKSQVEGKSELDALIAYLQQLGTALKSKGN